MAHDTPASGRSPHQAGPGTRVIDKEDADRFMIAADKYTAANTRTQAAAFQNLIDLGLIDATGQPTQKYK